MQTKKKRILIVDEAFFVQSSADLLKEEGYIVRIFCPNSVFKMAVTKYILSRGWDLVILDPAYYGRSDTKALNDLLKSIKSKVMIWHHYSDHGLKFDLTLEKPVDSTYLLKEIKRLLK